MSLADRAGGPRLTPLLLPASILLVLLVIPGGRASAQALYYRSIPVGERAVGLGGAFTGVASDPSSTFYNPGGLTIGGRFELLGSFSSLVLTRKRFENAFDTPGPTTTFETSNTTSLPRFIGTVVRFGKPRHEREHQFALGYSTLEVARDNLGDGYTENTPEISIDLRINSDYRARWYGISFGAQVTRKSSVGFTIFLSEQRVGYGENLGIARGGIFDPDTGLRLGGEIATTSGTASVRAYHFVPRLGWLHQINGRWRVGAMFQTPGIPLKQTGNVLRRVTATFEGEESLFLLVDPGDVKANLPIPFELRAGFGFQINATTLLSVDGAIAGPLPDKSVIPRPSELVELDRPVGLYFANSTKRRWTPNVAVGAEHRFGKVVVAGGLFTNISSAPDVPEFTNTYTPDQVNLYGAAFSIGVDTNGYRFTVGSSAAFGKGKALGIRIDPQAEIIGYSRTDATRWAVVMYIAGAVSVAAKGAKDVKEKIDDRGDDDEDGGDAQAPNAEQAANSETSEGSRQGSANEGQPD